MYLVARASLLFQITVDAECMRWILKFEQWSPLLARWTATSKVHRDVTCGLWKRCWSLLRIPSYVLDVQIVSQQELQLLQQYSVTSCPTISVLYITYSVHSLTTACTFDHTSAISYRRTSMWCLSAARAKLRRTDAWAAATHRNWSNTVSRSSSRSGVECAPMLCVGCWDNSRICWVVCSIIASNSVCIWTLTIWKSVYIQIRGQQI